MKIFTDTHSKQHFLKKFLKSAVPVLFAVTAMAGVNNISAETIDKSVLQNRTMFEVKNAYISSLPSYDTSLGEYKEEPSSTVPFKAGALKDEVVNDTIKQLNYFRWQFGLNSINVNTSYLYRNQCGAVAMAANGTISHAPARPAGMDDSFYQSALEGAGAGIGYSGNCASGFSMVSSIKGYIDDINVTNLGHRYSLLNPRAYSTSFGSCGIFSTLSMYVNDGSMKLSEPFYAWPSAGYFPLEAISAISDWSLTISGEYDITDNFKITLTADNGSSYTLTKDNVYICEGYSSVSFALPTALQQYLSGSTNNFLSGKSVSVKVTGLYNTNLGESAEFNYHTKFFPANLTLPTKISTWKNEGSYFSSVYNGIDMNVGDTANMYITIEPADTSDIRYTVTSSNPVIADWDSNTTSIKGLSGGTATLTFTCNADPSVSTSVTVRVKGPSASVTKITSSLYSIDYDKNLLWGVYTGTASQKVISNINEKENIHIFTPQNTELSASQYVGTGSLIKLMYNGATLQTLTAIVYGDTSGDGISDNKDLNYLSKLVLGSEKQSLIMLKASDMDRDNKISVYDALLLKQNIMN